MSDLRIRLNQQFQTSTTGWHFEHPHYVCTKNQTANHFLDLKGGPPKFRPKRLLGALAEPVARVAPRRSWHTTTTVTINHVRVLYIYIYAQSGVLIFWFQICWCFMTLTLVYLKNLGVLSHIPTQAGKPVRHPQPARGLRLTQKFHLWKRHFAWDSEKKNRTGHRQRAQICNMLHYLSSNFPEKQWFICCMFVGLYQSAAISRQKKGKQEKHDQWVAQGLGSIVLFFCFVSLVFLVCFLGSSSAGFSFSCFCIHALHPHINKHYCPSHSWTLPCICISVACFGKKIYELHWKTIAVLQPV